MTIAIAHDDRDSFNLGLALDLVRRLPGGRAPVLVYLTRRSGLVEIGAGADARLRPFGMLEDVWTLETLIDETQDAMAKAFHEEYLASFTRRREAGEHLPRRPVEQPWDLVSESFRSSNRALADHLPVKLRALGLRIDAPGRHAGLRITTLKEGEIELLARMEHARWCAERWLDGWVYAEHRDDASKRHPDLVSWDELPSRESRVDRDLMAAICRVLDSVGKGVFR